MRRCRRIASPGITRGFPRLYPARGLVAVALLTLAPRPLRGVRLACLIHAANVHSEPGSNPSKSARGAPPGDGPPSASSRARNTVWSPQPAPATPHAKPGLWPEPSRSGRSEVGPRRLNPQGSPLTDDRPNCQRGHARRIWPGRPAHFGAITPATRPPRGESSTSPRSATSRSLQPRCSAAVDDVATCRVVVSRRQGSYYPSFSPGQHSTPFFRGLLPGFGRGSISPRRLLGWTNRASWRECSGVREVPHAVGSDGKEAEAHDDHEARSGPTPPTLRWGISCVEATRGDPFDRRTGQGRGEEPPDAPGRDRPRRSARGSAVASMSSRWWSWTTVRSTRRPRSCGAWCAIIPSFGRCRWRGMWGNPGRRWPDSWRREGIGSGCSTPTSRTTRPTSQGSGTRCREPMRRSAGGRSARTSGPSGSSAAGPIGCRNRVLGQAIVDTGCSVRIFPRDVALRLPMFRGAHRFLGPLLLREGCRIVQVPVTHRPRPHGTSHYGFRNRSLRVVVDLLGVAWLLQRPIRFEVVEAQPALKEAVPWP